jgi:hypothetical protein
MTSQHTAQISYNYGCEIKKEKRFKKNELDRINESSVVNSYGNSPPEAAPHDSHKMSTITYVNAPNILTA